MSLRLLQKATSDAPKGKGKAKGGRRQSMSLQQFHQQTPAETVSHRPAWGKGVSMRTSTWAAEDPTPTGARHFQSAGSQARTTSSAWVRGPPSSAIDTLWDAAPMVEELSEDVWQTPGAAEAPPWEELSAEVAGQQEPVGVLEEADATVFAAETSQPPETMSKDATQMDAEETAAQKDAEAGDEDGLWLDIRAWLKHLNLLEHQEAIYSWCEVMGAASLEEVIECIDDLLEAVPMKALQAKRLQSKAQESLEVVRAEEAEGAGGGTSEAIPESSGGAGTNGTSHHADDAPPKSSGAARVQSFYKSLATLDDESPYLKQRPTEKATWVPTVKAASQGGRKRQQKERSKGVEQAKSTEDLEEQRKREEAQRLLEQQLREEQEKKLADARELIVAALERHDSQAFSSAVANAKEVGLPAAEVKEAEQQLNLALQRRLQKRNDALCALQAMLEAPKDERFGPAVRNAFEEAQAEGAIEHLLGGAAAELATRKALQEWELAEQQREDSRMALQFALRQSQVETLQVALSEAKKAGLADDCGLMAEAATLLQALLEKEKKEAEAKQKLQKALAEQDLVLLEEAVLLCKELHLPLRGADETLRKWRIEAAEKQAAEQRLQAAFEAEDPCEVREAIAHARSKLESTVLQAAEDKVAAMEALAKRREMAYAELCLACNARDTRRLQTGLDAAKKVGLPAERLQDAEDALQELQDQEAIRQRLCEMVNQAIQQRELSGLKQALLEAQSELLGEEPVMQKAEQICVELEEEARRQAEAALRRRSAEALVAAVDAGDWDRIQQALEEGLAAGLAEEGAPVRAAQAKLESLREAHEQQEAQLIVQETQARLEELCAVEGRLSGPSHKKERSAIGKEIMKLRDSEAYISARNFLKNPQQERQRREEQRLEIEKRAAEEKERRRRRAEQAPQELAMALEAGDEDALRALLVEAELASSDAQAAEGFLAECEEKRRRAERDGALLEFCFANLDRRAFFQASVTLVAFFTDQYLMHEGSDFKLKVVNAAHSVLVAFRSKEYAEAVKATAVALAQQSISLAESAVVAEASIRGAVDFSSQAEELLVSVRQDAEALKSRPARPECDEAIQAAAARSRGEGRQLSRKASALLRATSTTTAEDSRRPRDTPPSGATRTSERGGLYTGKGKGKVFGSSSADPDVFKIPKSSAVLQKDPGKAKTFQEDLRTFARNFHMSAELVGFDYVQLKPIGFVHQETKQKARTELQRLLQYYFPLRETCLRVRPESGAGIDLVPSEQGFLVENVEDFPGQDLCVGDVILQIDGHNLWGLSDEAMEQTFGKHFRDGAKLTVKPVEKV
ncbi:unnamed protein product [Durusdinium trenchii]|uniref:PDZ domain-containing protein n=1 Tax=Durusdinium trenchii TaxID=1381693 RepID=A0ABP0H9A6_9DINO